MRHDTMMRRRATRSRRQRTHQAPAWSFWPWLARMVGVWLVVAAVRAAWLCACLRLWLDAEFDSIKQISYTQAVVRSAQQVWAASVARCSKITRSSRFTRSKRREVAIPCHAMPLLPWAVSANLSSARAARRKPRGPLARQPTSVTALVVGSHFLPAAQPGVLGRARGVSPRAQECCGAESGNRQT